jgi:chromatin remodeling complex protein RSC6
MAVFLGDEHHPYAPTSRVLDAVHSYIREHNLETEGVVRCDEKLLDLFGENVIPSSSIDDHILKHVIKKDKKKRQKLTHEENMP